MDDRIKYLEKKIEELEDEVYRKRDGLADFLFRYIVEKYGHDRTVHQKARDTLLDAFGEVHANWRRI